MTVTTNEVNHRWQQQRTMLGSRATHTDAQSTSSRNPITSTAITFPHESDNADPKGHPSQNSELVAAGARIIGGLMNHTMRANITW